jgi:hypothetical protein
MVEPHGALPLSAVRLTCGIDGSAACALVISNAQHNIVILHFLMVMLTPLQKMNEQKSMAGHIADLLIATCHCYRKFYAVHG